MSRTIPILAYHKVDEEEHSQFWVSTKEFDMHMAALQGHGFSSVRLEDLWLSAHQGVTLPEKPVCITFDDGYENFSTKAFPILLRYGFIATVFLPTDFIGDSSRHLNIWDRSAEERSFPAAHLLWSEVVELHTQGIEFGAHTKTHPDLGALFVNDPQRATAEILDSRKAIESRLPCPTGFFSFPYKSSNTDLETVLRDAGFHGAVTMNGRRFDLSEGNWFCMDRIPVFSGAPGLPASSVNREFLSIIGETSR